MGRGNSEGPFSAQQPAWPVKHATEMMSLLYFDPPRGFPFLLEQTLPTFPSSPGPAGPAHLPPESPSPLTQPRHPAFRSHLANPTASRFFLGLCLALCFPSFGSQLKCLPGGLSLSSRLSDAPTGHWPTWQPVPLLHSEVSLLIYSITLCESRDLIRWSWHQPQHPESSVWYLRGVQRYLWKEILGSTNCRGVARNAGRCPGETEVS